MSESKKYVLVRDCHGQDVYAVGANGLGEISDTELEEAKTWSSVSSLVAFLRGPGANKYGNDWDIGVITEKSQPMRVFVSKLS